MLEGRSGGGGGEFGYFNFTSEGWGDVAGEDGSGGGSGSGAVAMMVAACGGDVTARRRVSTTVHINLYLFLKEVRSLIY